MFGDVTVLSQYQACRLKQKNIISAGLRAIEGQCAEPKAIEVASSYGLSLEHHRARKLSVQLCRDNDLILVMEKKHINYICKLVPEARGKTMLFGHWCDLEEIPDPYGKSIEAFEFVYKILEKSANIWSEMLKK